MNDEIRVNVASGLEPLWVVVFASVVVPLLMCIGLFQLNSINQYLAEATTCVGPAPEAERPKEDAARGGT